MLSSLTVIYYVEDLHIILAQMINFWKSRLSSENQNCEHFWDVLNIFMKKRSFFFYTRLPLKALLNFHVSFEAYLVIFEWQILRILLIIADLQKCVILVDVMWLQPLQMLFTTTLPRIILSWKIRKNNSVHYIFSSFGDSSVIVFSTFDVYSKSKLRIFKKKFAILRPSICSKLTTNKNWI